MPKASFVLKRVYEAPAAGDGRRVLVDRLWPRGVARATARIDLWLKDAAPSHDLRKRFHGAPDLWDEFVAAYDAELASDPAHTAALNLLQYAGVTTLLFAAREPHRNNAAALKTWLEARR